MKKILIIDDVETNRKLLEESLKPSGFETISAEDGIDGIYHAKKETPALILLDVAMPEVDGIEICKRLKEVNKLKKIPIIMVSAMNNPAVKKLAMEAGASDYLAKPFSNADLLEIVKKNAL